jgi:hypothetical protein
MLITPTPDPSPPPTWSDTTPAVATFTSSGLTASEVAVAPGNDVVNLTLNVGGQTFAATLAVEVDAVPQVLTSIAIVPGVVTISKAAAK